MALSFSQQQLEDLSGGRQELARPSEVPQTPNVRILGLLVRPEEVSLEVNGYCRVATSSWEGIWA